MRTNFISALRSTLVDSIAAYLQMRYISHLYIRVNRKVDPTGGQAGQSLSNERKTKETRGEETEGRKEERKRDISGETNFHISLYF